MRDDSSRAEEAERWRLERENRALKQLLAAHVERVSAAERRAALAEESCRRAWRLAFPRPPSTN